MPLTAIDVANIKKNNRAFNLYFKLKALFNLKYILYPKIHPQPLGS